jgi:hypothetical protein
MRPARSRFDDDLDAVDVLLVEDEAAADKVQHVLHQLALEAMERRATSPGDPRTEPVAPDVTDRRMDLARRFWARRRLRWATIAAVVLVLAVAPTVLDSRQTAARQALLAATPGVLHAATGPLAETWRTAGRVVSEEAEVLLVADASVGSLRRIDPATGAVVWTASSAAGQVAAGGHCMPVDQGATTTTAADGEVLPSRLVACVAEEGRTWARAGATAQVRVAVVETDTGGTRHVTATEGILLAARPLDGDLVVAVVRPDGRLGATRWDLETGSPSWEHVSAAPALRGATAVLPPVQWRPDSLIFNELAVDLRTGEEADVERERRTPWRYEQHVLADGALLTWSWDPDGDSGRGRVTREGRGRLFSIFGPPLPPAVSDGSGPNTLLSLSTNGERLRGLDLRTGRVEWSVPYRGGPQVRATAQVDGVALLDDGAAVTAVDVGSGAGLWTSAVVPGVAGSSALTDGEVVLLPVRGVDGEVVLVALRIADAAEVWRSGTPAGTTGLTVVDHHLVAATGDEVVGLAFGAGGG